MKENILFVLGFAGLFAAIAAVENCAADSTMVISIGIGFLCIAVIWYAVGSIFLD